ncbi:hypothetical protein COCCADRAFT_81194, partial [Bipolaris zeicola 26-R-13]
TLRSDNAVRSAPDNRQRISSLAVTPSFDLESISLSVIGSLSSFVKLWPLCWTCLLRIVVALAAWLTKLVPYLRFQGTLFVLNSTILCLPLTRDLLTLSVRVEQTP